MGEFVGTFNVNNSVTWGTAAPTAGTWKRGDLCFNETPSAGGVLGWLCVTAGSAGTWQPVGLVGGPYTPATMSSSVATITSLVNGRAITTLTTAAQNMPINAGIVLITLSAGANTLTLAQVDSHAAGFEQVIKNLHATLPITIVTAAGAPYSDAAAITLAASAKVVIVGDGSATWHNKST